MKLSSYADNMVLSLENMKDSTQKSIELVINKLRKVAGYQINTEKLVVFLYTNNDIGKGEYKKKISFKIISEIKI